LKIAGVVAAAALEKSNFSMIGYSHRIEYDEARWVS